MLPKFSAPLMIAVLWGCVGVEAADRMVIGQDISFALDRLGDPTDKREILGLTIYRWDTGSPQALFCNLSLVVDQSNKIISTNWDGNNGGCAMMTGRLRS